MIQPMLLVTGNGNIQEGYWKVAVNFFFCVTGRFEPQITIKNIRLTFNSGVE